MTSGRRYWPVVAASVVLVLGVVACSSPQTDSLGVTGSSSSGDLAEQSGSGASDSPTDAASENLAEDGASGDPGAEEFAAPVFTAVAPTPRLPVNCSQLFASLRGVSGAAVQPTIVGTARDAALAQAGFIDCELYGELSGTPVTIRAVVGADIPRSVAQRRVDAAAAAGHDTRLGAELSYSNCDSATPPSPCWGGVFANGYFAEVRIERTGTTAAGFGAAALQFTSSLASRVATWGPPPSAWKAPRDALRWASDCATDVASTDSPIVAAIPFSVGSPRAAASNAGFELNTIVDERVGLTWCEWGSGPSVLIYIVPGASWKFGQPGELYGSPYSFPGALATLDVQSAYSTGTITLVIDDSLVIATVTSEIGQPKASPEQLSSIPIDVAEAIVAEFGAR